MEKCFVCEKSGIKFHGQGYPPHDLTYVPEIFRCSDHQGVWAHEDKDKYGCENRLLNFKSEMFQKGYCFICKKRFKWNFIESSLWYFGFSTVFGLSSYVTGSLLLEDAGILLKFCTGFGVIISFIGITLSCCIYMNAPNYKSEDDDDILE